MKGILLILMMLMPAMSYSSDFNDVFCDSTLRIDCVLGGGSTGVHVMMKDMKKSAGWYGRRNHLAELPLQGDGTIEVVDPASGMRLYANPFSTLFQEWMAEEIDPTTETAFENSFLVPLPREEADIVLTLFDKSHQPTVSRKFRYSPTDELVAVVSKSSTPYVYLHEGGNPKETIDIAMLAEGFKAEEMDSFLVYARKVVDEVLSYEPFASNKGKFNFLAVMSPSADSGVSVPLSRAWKDTAFGSHFSTFHSPRYLTTNEMWKMYDVLDGIPFEHIMVLANTDQYGGGGIFNSYHISAVKNKFSMPVSVHEFGHSFAGLADEYFYANEETDMYPLDVEPWEPNITTLVDFGSKWKDMEGVNGVGLYEGGGYRTKGVYRPVDTCRMRDNYHPTFCPVCQRAIQRIIDFYVGR